MSLRTSAGMIVAVLSFTACGGGADPTVPPQQPVTTSIPAATMAPTTTPVSSPVTTASTTTSAPTTTTTTTVVAPLFVVSAPVDGSYTDALLLAAAWGDVRPEAEVTVNGMATDVSYVGNTISGEGVWRWHLWDDLAFEVGANDIVFEATFDDGSIMRETRTYHYDPTLQTTRGFILELTMALPPRAMLRLASLEYGEYGLEQTSDETEDIEVVVAPDAAFDVLGFDDAALDLGEFATLAASAARGEPLDLWWDVIFPIADEERYWTAAPWEFLLTTEGELQQAAQLYTP